MKIVNIFVSFALFIISLYASVASTYTLRSSKEFVRHTKSHVEYQEEEAKVSIKRIKRSDSDSPDSAKHDPYSITVIAFDTEYHANVEKPRRSIFAPNFKFQTLGEDIESNKIVLRDVTLSKEELEEIEDGHYVNPEKQASFSVRSLSDGGTRKIRGIIEDVAVTESDSSDNDGVTVTATKPIVKNIVNDSNIGIGTSQAYKDYLDPGPRPKKLGRTLNARKWKADCEPELFVAYDNILYNKFQRNIRDMTDYTAILFHAVNNRYATIKDVKIKFRISGIRAMTSPGAQGFMEQNRIPDGSGYDIQQTLQQFSESIYQNLGDVPKHDLALFITAADLQMKENSGGYQKATNGLAWVKGACFLNHRIRGAMGTSVSEDNGFYSGLYTITHELAHNLGSDHDGEGSSSDCSWMDGYIMSYLGYGTKNKFRFSRCSVRSMKNFVMTNDADCLHTFEHKNSLVAISKLNIGHRVTMREMCQTLMNTPAAVVHPDTDSTTLCRNIYCRYFNFTDIGGGRQRTYTSNYQSNIPAGDDIPCGNGGRCWDGECLQKLPRLFYRQ